MKIFIPHNVPSSKNSRVYSSKLKRSFPSKIVQKYKIKTEKYWILYKDKFLEKLKDKETPYIVGFHFVRNSKRRYDFINACQVIQDLMVEYEWLEDDNTKIMIPIPMIINNRFDSYDKENSGVYIDVFKNIAYEL